MSTRVGPVIGFPAGQSSAHPDLDSERLFSSIEAQGVRLAWSRAAVCPCTPLNGQTQQPDITCVLCRGLGQFFFAPPNYSQAEAAGAFDPVQTQLIENAAVIRGVVARVQLHTTLIDPVGRWVSGVMQVTVRPENRLGYFDRLIAIDSEVPFNERISAPTAEADGTGLSSLRYLATEINLVRSLTTVYRAGADFDLIAGRLRWYSGRVPAPDTTLSVHYHTHPSWRVVDHPHAVREIGRRGHPAGGGVLSAARTAADPTPLPIQALVQLEFLPTTTGAGG